MAKAVADVSGQNTGGFSPDGSNITGFSHMHDSGTGGNPSMGQFPLFPQYCPEDDINNCKYAKLNRAVNVQNGTVKARPGYFALELENDIAIEMTVTQHTALYHFTFPEKSTSNGSALHPMIMLDLTDIYDTRQNASISIDRTTGRMKGNGTFLPSFGAGSYMLHFCADFSGAEIFDSGMNVNSRAGTEPKDLFVTRGFNLFYLQASGFVRFELPENSTINARVGVSFISADKACQNAESEIPDYDFDRVEAIAHELWRERGAPISVDPAGVSTDLQKSFWSGIYRCVQLVLNPGMV